MIGYRNLPDPPVDHDSVLVRVDEPGSMYAIDGRRGYVARMIDLHGADFFKGVESADGGGSNRQLK